MITCPAGGVGVAGITGRFAESRPGGCPGGGLRTGTRSCRVAASPSTWRPSLRACGLKLRCKGKEPVQGPGITPRRCKSSPLAPLPAESHRAGARRSGERDECARSRDERAEGKFSHNVAGKLQVLWGRSHKACKASLRDMACNSPTYAATDW